MPIHYARDDVRRRIRITLTGPLTLADLIASVERQLAEGNWLDGLLVDARATFPAPPPSDMRLFASHVLKLIATHGPRGPIAVVARDASAIASAQLYLFFGGKTESIEVFWDLDDALQWLEQRLAQAQETSQTETPTDHEP
jgi:hypothetical protein